MAAPPIVRASEQLSTWVEGAFAVALLQGALRAGLLTGLREGRDTATLAADAGIDPGVMEDMLGAFATYGIAEREGGSYRLAAGFAAFAADDAPLPLALALESYGVMLATLARAGQGGLRADELPAIAAGVWGQAASPAARASYAALFQAMPAVHAIWQQGCRHIELGCGAGRDLLQVLVTYPEVRAVGVDLSAAVLAQVRQQAEALGVQDRLDLRQCDARSVEGEGVFDTVEWSQMFFPPETHAATLGVIGRLLRPGGYVLMPLLPAMLTEPDPAGAPPFAAAIRFVSHAWGNTPLPRETIRQAAEHAGFECIAIVPHPRTDFMVLRR